MGDAPGKRGHMVQWLSNRLLRLIRQAQGRSPTILNPEMDCADAAWLVACDERFQMLHHNDIEVMNVHDSIDLSLRSGGIAGDGLEP